MNFSERIERHLLPGITESIVAERQCVCFLNVGIRTFKGITQPGTIYQQFEVTIFWSIDNDKGKLQIRIICNMLAVCFSKQRDVHFMICMSLRRQAILLETYYGQTETFFFWLLRNWKIRCFTPRSSSRNKSSGNTFYRSAACILAFWSQGLAQRQNRVQQHLRIATTETEKSGVPTVWRTIFHF